MSRVLKSPALERPSRGACALLGVLSCLVACKSPASSKSASSTASAASPEPLSTGWQTERKKPLAVGEEAPDFEAIAHTGQRLRLSEFLDEPSVVYFYDSDASIEAVKMAEAIRDEWLNLNAQVDMVFGVSADHNVVHRDFATEHELPFLLVSDSDKKIAKSFGIHLGGDGGVVVYVVDEDREVVAVLEGEGGKEHVRRLEQALADEE